jgi:5-methylcytosine-specific restriction endonuclease McrA
MRTVLGRLGLMPLEKRLTPEEGHRILERDHYRCQYCGLDGMSSFENSLVMTVDFVVPRARKGKKDPRNLVSACRPCNVIKGHRVFKSLEETKAYVLFRRSELKKEWGATMARLQGRSATASSQVGTPVSSS